MAPEVVAHKIVIVEDEGLIAADLKGRLEDAGYAVPAIADTGVQALQVIAQTSPDLVVMDIRLKGDMDGIEVAERVRQEFDLPVVYLTAYEDRRTLERVGQSQAFGYLKKPVVSGSLRGTLDLALSKHHQERHLREQRDWFSSSFAAIPDAVVATDGLGRVSYLNSRAEELTGWSADRALGQPHRGPLRFLYEMKGGAAEELLPVEDLVPVALLEGELIPLPRNICLAGPERLHSIEGTIAPRWHEGRLAGTVIVFRAIDSRQLAEERSRQECKREGLTRLAASVVGHLDLELGVAADESTSLLQKVPADSPLRPHAETIEMAALDAFAVVGRLQSFVQPGEVHLQPVRINDLLLLLEPSWKQTVPDLSLLLGAVPAPAEANAYQLTRVLSILLRHAQDARRPDGGLVVETLRAKIPGMGPWLKIRVAYASFGENASLLERAFEPSWSDASEGLPAAYGLIREMGGFLSVALEQDRTVALEVYLRPSAGEGELPASRTARPGILLIEPNPRVGYVLQQYFDEHGLDLFCLATCQEARRAAEFYGGPLALVLGNIPEGDPDREELAAELALFKPDVVVGWLPGYRVAGSACGGSGTAGRLLTKRQVLEWAKRAISGETCVTGETLALGEAAAGKSEIQPAH